MMKKNIYLVLSLLVTVFSLNAQIDRSVQPSPGPSPKINLAKPQTFSLPNGLTVLVVENHKLPRVTFSLSLDNPPSLEGEIKGVDNLTSAMMGKGTSEISKDEFNERIDFYGASVAFGVHNVRGNSLSRYFPEILSLATSGALNPVFTEEELEAERAKILDALKADEKNVPGIARRVTNVLIYGKDHPRGEFITEETINNITLQDVNNYYREYFVPENAYLVIVGDVKFDEVKKLVTDKFSDWEYRPALATMYDEPENLLQTEINFIDAPNAVQTEINIVNVTELEMTSPDYFAALLANQILGGGADGRLFLNLRENHGWTYGAYSSIRGNKYVSNFSAGSSVKSTFADSAVIEIMNELKRIRETVPTEKDLELAKAKYSGSFIMSAEQPQTIANFALQIKTQNLPDDFYENYIRDLDAVTLEQVRAAAQKYILHDGARIVIVGKASEILPGIENLGIPVKFFDKYGNAVERPVIKQPDDDVTAQSVLENYIEATGGKEAWQSVKTLLSVGKASLEGNELTLTVKSTFDGKNSVELTTEGIIVTKAVFDGQKGYIVIQGQKMEMDDKQIETMKFAVPCPELLLLDSDIRLTGIDDNLYVLQLDDITYYYDMETGYRVKESSVVEIEGEEDIVRNTYYGSYREVDNIKIPFRRILNIGLELEFNIEEIKINEGVTDDDFL